MSKIFSTKNITVPIKFLTSLLFGWRYLSKQERENQKLLEQEWGASNLAYHRKAKAFHLLKRGRLLGLSKMLLKSLIFAVAGMLAYMVFNLAYSRKLARLKAL